MYVQPKYLQKLKNIMCLGSNKQSHNKYIEYFLSNT